MSWKKETIARIKQSTDLLQLAREYTEMTPLAANLYGGCCPHPDHSDGTPSFRVWTDSQSWACMACHSGKKDNHNKVDKTNFGSDCFAFVQWLSNGQMSWRDAVIYLANRANIQLEADPLQKHYDANLKLAQRYQDALTEPTVAYLCSRGLDNHDIAEWMIGENERRISFPLPDQYGRVVGFSERIKPWEDRMDVKYRNSATSEWFHKSKYLYGSHQLDRSFPEIRITEGPMDKILGTKYGVKNLVAVLGTAFTDLHIELVINLGLTPVFCYDPDSAGFKGVSHAVQRLSEAGIFSRVFFPPAGDLAEWAQTCSNPEEHIQNTAIPYWQFQMQGLVNDYHRKMTWARLQIGSQVSEILQGIPNKTEQSIMSAYVRESLGFDLPTT